MRIKYEEKIISIIAGIIYFIVIIIIIVVAYNIVMGRYTYDKHDSDECVIT